MGGPGMAVSARGGQAWLSSGVCVLVPRGTVPRLAVGVSKLFLGDGAEGSSHTRPGPGGGLPIQSVSDVSPISFYSGFYFENFPNYRIVKTSYDKRPPICPSPHFTNG